MPRFDKSNVPHSSDQGIHCTFRKAVRLFALSRCTWILLMLCKYTKAPYASCDTSQNPWRSIMLYWLLNANLGIANWFNVCNLDLKCSHFSFKWTAIGCLLSILSVGSHLNGHSEPGVMAADCFNVDAMWHCYVMVMLCDVVCLKISHSLRYLEYFIW